MAQIMMPVRVLDEDICKHCSHFEIDVTDFTCLYAANEMFSKAYALSCKNIVLCAELIALKESMKNDD